MEYSENTLKWKTEREKHPFIGEKLTKEMIADFWQSASADYTGDRYDNVREQIIGFLNEDGYLGSDKTLIDIGSGPGTYAFPLSQLTAHVSCMDASTGMLNRIIERCNSENINNISTIVADWDDTVPENKHDIAFSSLCPALNNPESILKMESCAKERCIYISSANRGRRIHTDIWYELGKEYSFEGYDTAYPFQFLKENGRTPILKYFSQINTSDTAEEDVVSSELKQFSKYRENTPELEEIIRNVVKEYSEDGNIHLESEMRLGVLVWNPLDKS